MAISDEVIRKNRQYLTQAQIDALVAAEKQYNNQNAGNRAGALANAREQYDTGYRGLQNMGLAGASGAAPTSGEVPRLQQQIRTPFEDYNNRLRDVERQRLGALGNQFAQQTQAQWAAEAERQRQAQEAAARARAAAAAVGVNTKFAAAIQGVEDAARQAQINAINARGMKQTAQVKQQAFDNGIGSLLSPVEKAQRDGMLRTARPQDVAAAAAFGLTHYTQQPAVQTANAAQERGAKLTEQYKGAVDTSNKNMYVVDEKGQAQRIQDITAKARADFEAAQKNVTNLAQARHGGGNVSKEEYENAVAQRDLAKKIADNPDLAKAFVEKDNPNEYIRSNANKAIGQFFGKEIAGSLGYEKPAMTDSQFNNTARSISDIRMQLNIIDSTRNRMANGGTGGEKVINDALAELKKLGYTEQSARELSEKFENERHARMYYPVYENAYVALYSHNGEKPTSGVNSRETDPTYRAVNKLPDLAVDEYNKFDNPQIGPVTKVWSEQEKALGNVDYMTPDQRNAYNSIYEREGLEAANKYANDIKPIVEMQRAASDKQFLEQLATENGVQAWALARTTNLISNVPAMIEKLTVGVKNRYNEVAGTSVPEIYSYDSATSRASNWADIIQSKQSQNILDKYEAQGREGLGKVVNFLYQTGTSMADSAIAMTIAGGGAPWLTDVLFFSSSGNQAYKDAIERGGTQEQALAFGVLSGTAEALFEHLSIEHFLNMDHTGRLALIRNMMSQSFAEASEEVATEIANILSDAMVMKDKSEIHAAINSGELGKYLVEHVGMAGLGGLASGLGFGLIGTGRSALNAAMTARERANVGKSVKEYGDIDQMKSTGVLLGGDALAAAEKVEQRDSDSNVGALTAAVQQEIQNLGATDVDSQVAVQRILDGKKMTEQEAGDVLDVLKSDTVAKLGYDASSPEAFASSYNERVEKHGITSKAERMAKSAAKKFAKAKESAANRVWANPEQGLSLTTPEGNTITPMPGNMTAVGLAEQERTGFKTRSTATKGKVTYAVAGMQAREGLSNEQTYEEIQKGLTKEAKKKAQVYEQLADALGVKMVIHDVMVGTNGFIDEKGNMHVVLSGKQSVLRVAAHELTHWMKDNAKDEYGALRNHLIAEVGQERFDRMLKRKAKEYGIDLSTDKGKTIADDEVCAELCERMLSNEEALEKFAEKDTAAARTLKEHLLKILNAIKDAFKQAENRNFGESWSDLIRQQDTIESWITGLQKAIENADARAQTNEGQIGKVAGVTTVDQNNLIDDIKDAKTDAEVDAAFNEYSVDVIEHDMAGYREDLVNKGMLSKAELNDLFDTMKNAVEYVKAHRAILDFGEELDTPEKIEAAKKNRAYNPYKQNADPHYKLALDFSTLCKKRILMQMIAERLQAKLGRAVSAAETIAIRREIQKLQKQGVDVEVACALCYVEAARLKSPKVINEFLGVDLDNKAAVEANVEAEMKNFYAQNVAEIRKDINNWKNDWKIALFGTGSGRQWWEANGKTDKNGNLLPVTRATKKDIEAYGKSIGSEENLKAKFEKDTKDKRASSAVNTKQNDEIDYAKRMVTEHPEVFLSAESLAKMKLEHPDVFYAFTNKVRSATRSKALETDTFYARGDISMVSDSVFKYANAESGFRHQSWSDFMPIHLLDTMAAVIEMSTKDAKMHAYTKVPAMIKLLGKTGMMLNMSLIPSGQTGLIDGKLAFDSVEGMDFDEMLALRDMFPDTAGNIAIGISDEQIKMLLASDDIDYVIPYHVSGLNKQLRTHMGIHTWLDFTSSQNESDASEEWKAKHKKNKMKPPALRDWFDEKAAKAAGANGTQYMQQAAQKYLDFCSENGWTPKFSQYLEQDADGRYHTKEGYENYWKMLTDRKMVNQKTGEVIIQQAVKPTFDNDTVMSILKGEAEDPAAIKNEAVAEEVVRNLSQTWRADRDNANLQDKKELNRFREAAAVMAAEQSAERVKQDIERRRQELNSQTDGVRYDLDTETLREIQPPTIEQQVWEANEGVRYSTDTRRRPEKNPGMKPEGREPRVREVDVPQYAKTGNPVSDFVRSFLESDKATDEMVADLQDKIANGEWGSYARLTNTEAMTTARDFIANRTLAKAQEEFHDMVKSGRYNVQTRAIGLQLLAEAAQRGDSEQVLNIATDLRELATDAGQSVQIFSALKELGGVGSAWYMQKKIDALNAKYQDQISAGKMNEITIDADLMQDLIEAKTTAEIEAAEDEIAKAIAKQLPLTWESRISNWRYLAMLANPTTHFRNLTGNFFMASMNKTKDAVAAGIERLAVRDISKRAHAVLTLNDRKTWGDYAEQNYADQEKVLRGNGKFGFETQLRQYMRAFDTKWLNTLAQGDENSKNKLLKLGNFGLLEKEDMWFIKPAYKNALMQYMKAQGYTLQDGVAGKTVNGEFKAMTKEQLTAAQEWAAQQAWKATFHDASVLATMLNNASKKLGHVGNVLIEGVMPFKKTPINIAKRGLEYSPVGIVMGAVQLAKDVKKGKVTTAAAIDNIASGITGSTLMAVGAILAKMGLLRSGGEDKKKHETYLSDTGDQTYALKIGDASIGLSALAPATIPLFMGAALYDALDKHGEGLDLSALTETVANTLNPFMEMSFMSSLNSALKSYNNDGIGGALGNTLLTAAESYGSQFLPTVVAKAGQVFDPINRTTKSSAASKVGSGLDYYARSLAKKVPGLEATLQPDVDVWGRTTNTMDSFGKWALDFANKFIFPANVKVANKTAIDDELIRVVESTGNVDILPSDGQKYFTVKGEKYPMTAAQYTEYSIDRGQASYVALKETMMSDAYKTSADEVRADMLKNALSAAQKQVNNVWKEKLGAIEGSDSAGVSSNIGAVDYNDKVDVPKTEVQATKGEYSDPALYKVAASYPNAYDKAAKAKAKGVSPDTFLDLYGKKESYVGDDRADYMRQQIMSSNLTAQQKELMDDLIISDKGQNPDYSSQAWFDVSMLGKTNYDKAKKGEKLGISPETYLSVYNKSKEISAAKLGNKKKATVTSYLDSLKLSATAYDYLMANVFGYTR